MNRLSETYMYLVTGMFFTMLTDSWFQFIILVLGFLLMAGLINGAIWCAKQAWAYARDWKYRKLYRKDEE